MRVPVQKAVPAIQPEIKKRRWRLPRLSFKAGFRLFLFLVVLVVVGSIVYTVRTIPKRFNVLVIGSDQRADERGRSDVLMVVSVAQDPKQPVSILTIPRDTRVEVEGFGLQKITHAYALGDTEGDGKSLGNRRLTEKTVEHMLDISIDGTLEITFKSFQDIIDQLGGITTKQYGRLDGEAALKKVRNRSREGGDFARTEDQREILMEVVNEIRTQKAYQDVYSFLKDSTESRLVVPKLHLALFSAYAILRRGGNLNFKDVHNDVIPGKSQLIYTPEFKKELYYWVPDETKTKEIVAEWFS